MHYSFIDSFPSQYEDKGNIKEKISNIQPVLENMKSKKQERMKEFLDTETQIAQICAEIAGNDQALRSAKIQVNELDLTTKKLQELKLRLQDLQSEKVIDGYFLQLDSKVWMVIHFSKIIVLLLQRLRLQKVIGYISAIHDLSVVMSVDFVAILGDIHPSLHDDLNAQPKNISNETLARLTSEVSSLKQMKKQRLQKVIY